jgi:hypothetical protein
LAAPVTPDTAIALEATGHAFPLDDRRADRAGHVTGAPPLWLKHFESGRHSDRVDAEHLAQMLAIGPWPIVFGSRRRRGASSGPCSSPGEACSQMARTWQNRAKSALLRQGWALPAREPVTTGPQRTKRPWTSRPGSW